MQRYIIVLVSVLIAVGVSSVLMGGFVPEPLSGWISVTLGVVVGYVVLRRGGGEAS